MPVITSGVASAIGLLTKLGWQRGTDLAPTQGGKSSPVFYRTFKRCELKCVVGDLWTTYYRLTRDVISDMDSVKTDDVEGLKAALNDLLRLVRE